MKKVKVAEKIKNNSPFASFANVVRHFFPNLTDWLDGMDDPRHASYIKYSQGILCGSLIMKDICGLESMQAMNKTFMMDEARGNLAFLFGDGSDTEAPHYQTINNWCKGVEPNELQEVLTKCVKGLVAGKLFNDARVDGEWLVILDASGYAKSDEKFSEHCLKKTRQGSGGKAAPEAEGSVSQAWHLHARGLAVLLRAVHAALQGTGDVVHPQAQGRPPEIDHRGVQGANGHRRRRRKGRGGMQG